MWPAPCGGPTMQTFGMVSLCASSSAVIGRPPAPFSPMRRPASTHTARSAAMKSRSASSASIVLVRRLAEIGRARDHHRHRHIDAGHRVAGHLVHRAAGRQQPAGLGAHRVGEEQVDARERAVHAGDLGRDEPAIGADPHARPRGHAGVGVEDVDLERLAGAGRLHLPGVERPERQRRGHVAAVHAPVDRRLVGGKLGEGADDAPPVALRLQPGEEHLVAGRHDPPQPGDLLVAGARAFQRQSHQMAQQFLAQSPARAAPSVPRSPARWRCRRARGAPETRCIPPRSSGGGSSEAVCMDQDPDCRAPQLLRCGCEVHCGSRPAGCD